MCIGVAQKQKHFKEDIQETRTVKRHFVGLLKNSKKEALSHTSHGNKVRNTNNLSKNNARILRHFTWVYDLHIKDHFTWKLMNF